MTDSKVTAVTKANAISARLELPAILDELEKQRLIDKGDDGIAVLGLTTAQTLEHNFLLCISLMRKMTSHDLYF